MNFCALYVHGKCTECVHTYIRTYIIICIQVEMNWDAITLSLFYVSMATCIHVFLPALPAQVSVEYHSAFQKSTTIRHNFVSVQCLPPDDTSWLWPNL